MPSRRGHVGKPIFPAHELRKQDAGDRRAHVSVAPGSKEEEEKRP